MINLEKAKELAKVLPWDPNEGDTVYYYDPVHCDHGETKWVNPAPNMRDYIEYYAIPSLSQLLTEVEKRGWNADSVMLKDGGYGCDIYYLSKTVYTKYMAFAGESREDAAAEALLHILRQ